MGHVAYMGLGSNLGDRRSNLSAALARLRGSAGVLGVWVSSLHETAPVGGPEGQELYLNAAARIETSLEPHALLALFLAIEHALGRERFERWGPRTVDLDLLLFEDRVIDTPDLIVPHPRMHERAFVLEPLAEIAEQARHPTLGLTVRELLQRVHAGAKKRARDENQEA